ncbi:MAG: hypothetical protein GX781_07750, partial [Clostridiales bacterium]|nr:hypothetical protein [Clostridiales bacterium]
MQQHDEGNKHHHEADECDQFKELFPKPGLAARIDLWQRAAVIGEHGGVKINRVGGGLCGEVIPGVGFVGLVHDALSAIRGIIPGIRLAGILAQEGLAAGGGDIVFLNDRAALIAIGQEE